jgi:hypothetical protein
MKRPGRHLVRDLTVVVTLFVGLVAAGWIVEGGGFAAILALMATGIVVLFIPFVFIHLEEATLQWSRGRRR